MGLVGRLCQCAAVRTRALPTPAGSWVATSEELGQEKQFWAVPSLSAHEAPFVPWVLHCHLFPP